jgi:hypothetical protein
MALAFRAGSFVSAGNASGGDLSINKPTGTASGDIMVYVVYFEPDTTTISITGSFTSLFSLANTGAFKLEVFARRAGGSEPATFTVSNSTGGNQWRAAVGVAYSGGTGTGTLLDLANGSQADGALNTAQTAPSITTTGTDRMLVFGYGNFSGTNMTAAAGAATNLRGSLGGCALVDALRAAAGATGTSNPSSGVGTDDYVGIHAAIISDTGGAGKVTKNTRSHPLGVNIGMGWRMPL